jgi:hypothetical protein
MLRKREKKAGWSQEKKRCNRAPEKAVSQENPHFGGEPKQPEVGRVI